VHCVDLDRFKEVNDTLGHGVGDALLVAVGERMRGCLREHDTLARFGGDEFAIIQEPVAGPEEAGSVAERVVETLSQPFLLEGNEVLVSASVGIGVAPGDGSVAADLLRHADMALYRAKNDGRARVRFFTAEMNATLLERRALEQDLRRTLAAGGLSVHYQPKYGLRDRRLIGLEALVRWEHPEHGFVPPAGSCRSPRRPASSASWASGCSAPPAGRPAAGSTPASTPRRWP
jgi:diguanylate cyclase (GGDEF)-like protein